MRHSLNPTQSAVPLLCPTVFEIEEEHYRQATTRSRGKGESEADQWHHYLRTLGLLVFQDWLTEQASGEPLIAGQTIASQTIADQTIAGPTITALDHNCLQIGAFRVCVWVTEECLSEQVTIPRALVEDGTLAAHFYVLLEVAEEQSEVWFRGIVRRDRLAPESPNLAADRATDGPSVTLPLSGLEPEPSRLLHYCQYLDPAAIPLPSPTATSDAVGPLSKLRTQLSRWLEDMETRVDTLQAEGWQVWDSLQPSLAYATRSLAEGIRRGKLVNVSLDVGVQPVALVLTLVPEADEKISILVQLLPTGSDRTLVPNIELALLSKKGKVLQQLLSRSQDNYVQLKSFRGTIGQQFSLRVTLDDISITEQFEI